MRGLFILVLLLAFTGGHAVAEPHQSEEGAPVVREEHEQAHLHERPVIFSESRGITQ